MHFDKESKFRILVGGGGGGGGQCRGVGEEGEEEGRVGLVYSTLLKYELVCTGSLGHMLCLFYPNEI